MCMTTSSAIAVLPQNEPAAKVWDLGGSEYNRISRQIADAIEHCVDRLAPRPGERILDVATGTGWTARRIAERGSDVIGVDFSQQAIEAAKALAPSENIEFMVGDAEALPFPSESFDAVCSTFGVMFCANPAKAAAELIRVCKPGGRVVMANWEKFGGVYEMFQVVSSHKPTAAATAHSPFDWSDKERLQEWFGPDNEVLIEEGISLYREAHATDAWEAFATGYGPVKSLIAALSEEALASFRDDFIAFHERHRTPAGILVQRPYKIVIAKRAN